MCSTIILGADTEKFLAANYDISMTHGLVATNIKGTIKENGRAFNDKVVRWQVEYGSVTFNQSSLELPAFGMNEKGLAIALMWHDEGDFGENKRFARMNPLQWIQYQLDTRQNIDEVIQGLNEVRPRQEVMPLHYMLLDARGDCLILEFLNGELKMQRNPEYPMLTNSSYLKCLDFSKNSCEVEQKGSSLARFDGLFHKYVADRHGKSRKLDDFSYLDDVKQIPGGARSMPWNKQAETVTAWSMHFCPAQSRIIFKTVLNPSIREINLDQLNFDAKAEYMLLDVDEGSAGQVNHLFQPYAKHINANIVHKTGTEFAVPESVQEELIGFVDTMYSNRCLTIY